MQQPQEIVVTHVLPYIRAQIAIRLKERIHLKHFQIAKIMGLTEAAISQYLQGKRGTLNLGIDLSRFQLDIEYIITAVKSLPHLTQIRRVNNPPEVEEDIKQAQRIIFRMIANLLSQIKSDKTLCEIHKAIGDDIPENCDLCDHL